jgi:hypothetical protein
MRPLVVVVALYAAQILAHRTLAQPQASPNDPLRQLLLQSQPQKFTYLSHRQSLAWHLDRLLLGKRSKLPSVEDRQRRCSVIVTSAMIRITGIGDRDPTESMIRIEWNE